MPFFKVGTKWMQAAVKVGRCSDIYMCESLQLFHCLSFPAFFVLSAQRNSSKVGIKIMMCGCQLLQKWVSAAAKVGRSRVCGDSAAAAAGGA